MPVYNNKGWGVNERDLRDLAELQRESENMNYVTFQEGMMERYGPRPSPKTASQIQQKMEADLSRFEHAEQLLGRWYSEVPEETRAQGDTDVIQEARAIYRNWAGKDYPNPDKKQPSRNDVATGYQPKVHYMLDPSSVGL